MKKLLMLLVGMFMFLLTTALMIALPQAINGEMDFGQKFIYWYCVFCGYFISFMALSYKLGKTK